MHFTYRIGTNFPILNPTVDLPLLRPRNVDHAVDDHVRDVDTLGTELAGQRLRQGTLCEFAGGEEAEARRAAHRSGRASDDQRRRVGGVGVDGLEEEGQGGLGEVEEASAVGGKGGCEQGTLK